MIKIVFCGPAGVGRGHLMMKIMGSGYENYRQIAGVYIFTKDIELSNGRTITCSLWEFGGHERFSFVQPRYYKGARGAVLIFDLSQAATWDEIKNWRTEVKRYAGDIPFMMIGNKLESLAEGGEVINREEARAYTESMGGFYFETRSDDSIVINEALLKLVIMILEAN